ncbi:MAG: winged helix DNA-binding domain-containing protein [Theionarchaea archaeon]|nr:winged helix DNA-binding domain-containing protein [Theionarchaea archaeon]
MITVSIEAARNILSSVHGFTMMKSGIEGTLEIFGKHQCVQSDPIEVMGTNADLTLHSRISDYKQKYLDELLYENRNLFEYYLKAFSIQPMEKYPFFCYLRNQLSQKHASFFTKYERETNTLLEMMESEPVASRDITGWEKPQGERIPLPRMILGRLWACGKTLIHHRKGAIKYYTLSDDIVPQKYLYEVPDEECIKEMVRILVRAARLVSPSGCAELWHFVGNTQKVRILLKTLEKEGDIFQLQINGYRNKLIAPVEDKEIWESPYSLNTDFIRFLAPLDPLNWNRALFKAIYEIEYSWEAYKKPKDRKYGYYCLPILYNGDIVGLIEPFFRKKDRIIEIRSFHVLKVDFDRTKFKNALNEELQRFSENLKAKGLEFKCNLEIS